jgi:hypothetical protein
MVKCTVKLPADIWRAAKIRALDERDEFQRVVARALDLYLKTKPRKEGGR